MARKPTDVDKAGVKETTLSNEPVDRYRDFLLNSTLGIWRCDLDKPISKHLSVDEQLKMVYKYGYMAEANDTMAAMYGLKSGDELKGMRLKDLLPEDEPRNQAYLRAFVESNYKLRDAESQELDSKGNTKYFLNSLMGIIEGDLLLGAWGTQLDVTHLHETSEALKESEARLELALEVSGVGMWEWDIENDTLHWSDQLKKLFGVPDNYPVTLQRYYQIIHPDDIKRTKQTIMKARGNRKNFEVEHRVVWQDGSVHWVLGRGRTMYEGSKPVKMVGTCMNIDERKAADDLRLSNAKMDEERQKLLEVNLAKDEFIALASHQLRTPATSVKQYLGILLEGVLGKLNLSESQLKILQSAYESNERQINIVNDLLLVATIDAGKMKLHKRPVDIGKLVRNIMQDSYAEFGARKHEIKIKTIDEPLVLVCDHERVRMALENVITNAFKYSPDDSLVTIEVIRRDKSAVIRVIDRGVGIAKKDLPKLFLKFSRIDNPLSISSGGTGLGLYWTEKIIALHGGKIRVSSIPGTRTTFTITLPL